MKNRTVYFKGVQLAYKSTETLIQLIDEKIKTITKKISLKPKPVDLFDKDRIEGDSLFILKRQLIKHLSQWRNVQLGDKVEYDKS